MDSIESIAWEQECFIAVVRIQITVLWLCIRYDSRCIKTIDLSFVRIKAKYCQETNLPICMRISWTILLVNIILFSKKKSYQHQTPMIRCHSRYPRLLYLMLMLREREINAGPYNMTRFYVINLCSELFGAFGSQVVIHTVSICLFLLDFSQQSAL
jgi:hypothetical protein